MSFSFSLSSTTTTTTTCSDPLLYSLKNHGMHLPPPLPTTTRYPIGDLVNKRLVEKNYQFSDTSCQERSIMIDKLIDTSADIIDSIWRQNAMTKKTNIMTTSQFIREILKRSRATYSMLQLGLFYIFRIKKLIQDMLIKSNNNVVGCGRRMFLAALMCASKYLNDKNYRNKTWAKIASLPVNEINKTETVFLQLIEYKLYVSKPLYDKWVSLLHDHIQKKQHFIQQQQQQQQSHFYYPSLYTTSSATTTHTTDFSSSHQLHPIHLQQQQQHSLLPLHQVNEDHHHHQHQQVNTPSLSPSSSTSCNTNISNHDEDEEDSPPLCDISQTPLLTFPVKRKAAFIHEEDDDLNHKHIRLE